MPTQVILLEKIEKLGEMGDTVNVKPGYARNYLLPQHKALRATKENIAYFQAQKAALEKANAEKRKEAEKRAKNLDGLKVPVIRQASESGQLYGSVTARDIADAISGESGETVERSMVRLNRNFKIIGLFPVDIVLHPEVTVTVTINIARSEDEADIQAKTGKALVADAEDAAPVINEEKADEAAADAKEDLLEDSALQAEKEQAAKEAEEAAKAQAKAAEDAEEAEAADGETSDEKAEDKNAEGEKTE